MALHYQQLDTIIRALMLEELHVDIAKAKLYQGKRLTDFGFASWSQNLEQAIRHGSDSTLETDLLKPNVLLLQEPYTRNGVQRFRKVNLESAARMFAEGEFNRFYIRGICRCSLQLMAAGKGDGTVTAYRARPSLEPRPESELKIGITFSAAAVLADLRENTSVDGVNTALGLPSGPNSGISVRY